MFKWKKPKNDLDIDIRFLLANERTLLAWVRTGLTLIAGGVASPVFLLDEIDKTPGRGSEDGDPLGPLHDLLEPSSAQRVEDDCLKLHFDARHVIWMATANDLGSLPPSLLDRFLILEVQRPSQSQMQIVLEHLYREVILDWGDWFEPSLCPEAREGLRAAHPRKARHHP